MRIRTIGADDTERGWKVAAKSKANQSTGPHSFSRMSWMSEMES
ncbi:hypothetical protein [Lysinibacillus sphaericus]|nr:hypothetical protein [Lysinibacillus sp. SDF0037]